MRRPPSAPRLVPILAVTLAAGLAAALPGPAGASQVENLLEVCSDQKTPPGDAYQACRRVAEEGRLDARRRSLAWLNAGIAAHALGRYAQAASAHGRAIEADPRLAAAFENRALAYQKLGRADDALRDYATAISLDPQSAGAYLGRGNLGLAEGRPEQALADFSRAAEIRPDLLAAHYNRGVALSRLGRHDEAESAFSAVIGRDPRDAGAWLGRGQARAALGKASAINDFGRAIALRPEWAEGYYARGRYLDRIGETEAANADLLKAYRLGYSDSWLIERLRGMSGQ